jgi:hypothetical protein
VSVSVVSTLRAEALFELEVGLAEASSGCGSGGMEILSMWIFARAASASGSPDITRCAVSCDMLETDR